MAHESGYSLVQLTAREHDDNFHRHVVHAEAVNCKAAVRLVPYMPLATRRAGAVALQNVLLNAAACSQLYELLSDS